MYKLLIIEDEETIREGICSSINWNEHNIFVCAEANNGEEALNLLELHKPDIVLTDIQMPKMNGLEFITQARSKDFIFEAIILTGYADFDYARKSILLGVSDYILKPAQPHEILETVLKVKQKLDSSLLMDTQFQLLEQYKENSNHFKKIEKLNYWLHFPKQSETENKVEIVHNLQMNINPSQALQVGIIRLVPTNTHFIDDYELYKFACLNITTEALSSFYDGKLEVFYDQDLLVWVGNTDTSYDSNNLLLVLSQLIDSFHHYLKINIYLGIGNPKQSIDDLYVTYQEANQVLQEHYFNKGKNVFFYQDFGDREYKEILLDKKLSQLEEELIIQLTNKQYDSALDTLEKWLSYLKECDYYNKDQINLKVITLIVELQKLVHGKTLTKIEWENNLVNWLEQIPNMRTFDEISIILKKIFQNIFELLTSEQSVHRTVQLAQQIIHENYYKNITLESIANEVFVSSSYLSTLFKQELGINFLDYLHQHRITQAKILLAQNYKIYEVAYKTGYKDERNFSTTFKKWNGITPSQFQKETKITR